MPDELDIFFARKKNKDKKKNALHVGDIAEYLDQTNRNIEIMEREEKEFLQIQNDKDAKDTENGRTEESEWLEINQEDIQFAEIGIKDIDISELTEDEEEQDTKIDNNPAKTWNTSAEPGAQIFRQEVMPSSKKYVPPTSRVARKSNTNFDVKNEEMFPSLANADKIEKVEKTKVEDRKQTKANQQSGWKTQGEPKSSAYRPPQVRPTTTASSTTPIVPKPATPSTPSKTHKYIPPSKRNQQ